jgi:hypothetical protein
VDLFKAKQDFDDAIKIIEDSLILMKQGKYHHFKSIATQLYILLIERGNKKGPLVKEIIPNLKLHPIYGSIPQRDGISPLDKIREILGEDAIFYPSKLVFRKGKPIAQYTFDESEKPIDIEEI